MSSTGFVCKTSFTVERDHGEWVKRGEQYFAGISLCAAGADVLRYYPEKFTSDRSAVVQDVVGFRSSERGAVGGGSSRRSTRSPGSLSNELERRRRRIEDLQREAIRDDAAALEVPELRTEAASVSLSIGPLGKRTLRDEILKVEQLLEQGTETGGWLFALRDFSSGRITYSLMPTGLGIDGRRAHHEVELGLQSARSALRRAESDGVTDRHVFAGAWHCHPRIGATKPSEQDRWASLRRLDQGGFSGREAVRAAPFVIDLICTPNPKSGNPWMNPLWNAWVTDRSGRDGRAITRPAAFPTRLEWWSV